MERKVNFNKMNLYVRFVQRVEGIPNCYYLPWRIIYDNFLIFMDEGSITLRFDNKEIELHENDIYIIPPFLKNKLEVKEHTHCWYYGVHFDYLYEEDSEDFNEDVYIPENMGYIKENLTEIPVDEKLLNRDVYQLSGVCFPEKIRIRNPMYFRELFGKLLKEFHQDSFGHEIIVKSTFYEMMYMIVREIADQANEDTYDQYEAIYRYLQNFADDSNGNRNMDIAQLALEYGMSQKKFRSVFKNIMKKTPKEYSIEYKIRKAKELLETGRYQVGEVAYMLGYDDVFYFSKLFKRKVGISPKNFIVKTDFPENRKETRKRSTPAS